MNVSDLLPLFDRACLLWAAHDADPDAPDVAAGDLLDIASDLQVEIMREAAFIPAATEADVEAKQRMADHIDLAFAGAVDTADLRRSIAADRFGHWMPL